MRVNGVLLQNTQFDLPVVVNTMVEEWVAYFTGRGRKHFEVYLRRSEYFIPYFQPILRRAKMPEDLVYLAMIESGFNNHAKSHAKAVGPWQFMPATGRRYSLAVNWWVDERRDVRRSTLAAIQYLSELYGAFGSWELAAAGYNAGEAKVARAIQRYATNDFWAIARQRYLKPETRHYVPKLMAAAIVSKNRTQFGFPASYGNAPIPDEELEDEEEDLTAATKKEEGATEPVIDDPQLKSGAATALAPRASDAVSLPTVTRAGEVFGQEIVEFEIESPADLMRIASAAGLTYQEVKALNPALLRWCTPPTEKKYRIKLPASAKDKFLANYNHPAFPREIRFRTYTAKAGDSPLKIARRLGIQPDPILDLNRVSSKHAVFRGGTQVTLPLPVDRSRSMATLEIVDPPTRRSIRKRHPQRRSMHVDIQTRRTARSTARNGVSR
jgi:membrane-bound lytic murein transglycosylase D